MADTKGQLKHTGIEEQPPSLVLDLAIHEMKRGKRQLHKWADPKRAQGCFSDARSELMKLAGSVRFHYRLEPEEIEDLVGPDIRDINDTLAEHTSVLSERAMEAKRLGKFRIERSFLVEVEQTQNQLELYRDVMNGIERGEIEIE